MPLRKELLVDTNVVLRFLLADISELYERARDIFQKAEEGKLRLILSDIVISECIWVLEKFYHIDREEIEDKLTNLILHESILTETSKTIIKDALSIWSSTFLDWSDSFLVAKAKNQDKKLVTFDKEIIKNFSELCI